VLKTNGKNWPSLAVADYLVLSILSVSFFYIIPFRSVIV